MADLVWDMRTRQRQLFQNVVLKDLATSLSKKSCTVSGYRLKDQMWYRVYYRLDKLC